MIFSKSRVDHNCSECPVMTVQKNCSSSTTWRLLKTNPPRFLFQNLFSAIALGLIFSKVLKGECYLNAKKERRLLCVLCRIARFCYVWVEKPFLIPPHTSAEQRGQERFLNPDSQDLHPCIKITKGWIWANRRTEDGRIYDSSRLCVMVTQTVFGVQSEFVLWLSFHPVMIQKIQQHEEMKGEWISIWNVLCVLLKSVLQSTNDLS